MVAAIVYAVIGDTLFIRMVWISSTSLTELVMLRAVSRVSLMTAIPSTRIQLLILCFAADTFLENYIAIQSMICYFYIIYHNVPLSSKYLQPFQSSGRSSLLFDQSSI